MKKKETNTCACKVTLKASLHRAPVPPKNVMLEPRHRNGWAGVDLLIKHATKNTITKWDRQSGGAPAPASYG